VSARVVFAPNWLGDAVMALPAIRALRAAWPDDRVDVAVRPAVAPLFSMVPEVGCVTLERGHERAALSGRGYETAILFPNSFAAAWLVKHAAIPHRWGYAGNFRAWLLTRAVVPPSRLHQIEFYSSLVRRLGFAVSTSFPRLDIDATLRAQGIARLKDEGWNGESRVVAMAPGAAFGTAKRWPPRSYAAIADRLADRGDQVVLVGAASDRGAADDVVALARRGGVINLAGRTDLRMLAAVLAAARLMYSNDSGAMHLAAALSVPVAAMMGPTREHETHPAGAAPHIVLTHEVWCRPCMLRECPLTHRCMTGITPEMVWRATESLL
jgi:heptosyltransferase-2